MGKAAVISGRVAGDLALKLDRLATKMDRPRGWVVAQAVEKYVLAELAFLESLEEADAQIDRGEFFTQDQMEDWFLARYAAPPAA